MKTKKIHSVLFFNLLWICVFGQYKNINLTNGLPSDHVYTIREDKQGYIWFLTDKGMVQYNGQDCKVYTTKNGLPKNDIWEAFITNDNKVWYITKAEQLGYIENGVVYSFFNEKENLIIDPIFSSKIGNKVYPTGPLKTYSLEQNKWKILNDNLGDKTKDIDLLFHSKLSHISFQNDSLQIFGKNGSLLKKHYLPVVSGKGRRKQLNNNYYVWSKSDEIVFLNLETLEITRFSFEKALGIKHIQHARILVNNEQIQFSGSGVWGVLNEKLELEASYLFPKEIPAHFGIRDRSGHLWLATFGQGVYQISNATQQQKWLLKDQVVQHIDIDQNQLIASVRDQGFFKYQKNTSAFEPYIKDPHFLFGVHSLPQLNKSFYTSKGNITAIHHKKNQIKKHAIIDNDVFARKLIFHDKKLYSSFSFGINQLDYDTLEILENIENTRSCNDLIVFNHRLIAATASGLKEIVRNKALPLKFSKELFNKDIVQLRALTNNELLIGTDGFGAFVSDLKQTKPIESTAFLSIKDVFVEPEYIWVLTNTGILQLENKKPNYRFIRSYDEVDGIPTQDLNGIAVFQNKLFIGTNKGLLQISLPWKPQKNHNHIYIQNASYHNKNLKHTPSYTHKSSLNFEIDIVDLSNNKNQPIWKYRLSPLQKKWTDAYNKQLSFYDPKPGDYTLEIQYKEQTNSYAFSIQPLFWQRQIFKIALWIFAFMLVAVGSILIANRLQRIRNRKKLQEQELSQLQLTALRSQMNPHFVFNSLSAIQYYINQNDFEASERYLVKFAKLIRQFFALSKKNTITLEEEITLLRNYLYIEKLRFKSKLQYAFRIDQKLALKSIQIPTMLLQPIVENAVNHGVFNKKGNGMVIIEFEKINKQTIAVKIQDDGIGMLGHESNGAIKSSQILKDRLHFLKKTGKWYIQYEISTLNESADEKGCVFQFKIEQLQ
ncbi:MAG: histidine kinase [Flavobacteriaceae bacterium]|nr:histidine kinase [Flavobacteriaceae bacterium]